MKQTRFLPVIIVLTILLACSASLSTAQGPAPQEQAGPQAVAGSAFTYQGQLLKDGSPVNDTCTMVFRLYDDPAAGNPRGNPITMTVTVANGLFTVLLNSAGEFGVGAFSGLAHWLEVAVQCPGDAAFSTLVPRQALTAAPYALSLRPGAIVDGALEGQSALVVVNRAAAGRGLWGQSDGTAGIGVRGYATASSGDTYGVHGRSNSSSGAGVYGQSTATEGNAYGVRGLNNSPRGAGVFGKSEATSGDAPGVLGGSWAADAPGVYGFAENLGGDTAGVMGQSVSPAGRGVYGWASATSGFTSGVYGQVDSPDGAGVYGSASTASGFAWGVRGESASTQGAGVYGASPHFGVVGIGTAGGSSADGVVGINESTAGYGVYYIGGLGGTGLKTSIIETQDYGWRGLYSMESPDVLFEDVGTARLVDGQADVSLDPIFAQTVNLEQPYQVFLTPQGDCGLYIVAKQSTSFTVRALDGEACNIAFDYRIVAKRLGYEGVRLAPAVDPTLTGGITPASAALGEQP